MIRRFHSNDLTTLHHSPNPVLPEGLSYLVVTAMVAWSVKTKISSGSGLPAGPYGLVGAAEGLSFLAIAAGRLRSTLIGGSPLLHTMVHMLCTCDSSHMVHP